MRILEYGLELHSNGYTVTSGYKHYEDLEARECLPIKMTVLDWCSDRGLDDLPELFDHNYWGDDSVKSDPFYQHCEEIFRGEHEDWILIQFQVHASAIVLDYYNRRTEKTGWLNLRKVPGKWFETKLQFDVPRRDGGPASRYLVTMSHAPLDNCTGVTEYIQGVRRELDFGKHTPQDPDSPDYVWITEYADL